jgi:hypothetical protein
MNVFWHDDVTANDKIVADTHGFEGVLEKSTSGWCV